MEFWKFGFFLFFLFFNIESCRAKLITSLPGQPSDVSFKQFSGYTITDAKHGRALFYYFVEAQAMDPLSRPLTLWFNGGPGCSSLGFGAFMEHGPFQPGQDGLLVKNQYSWNLESNMLYVETPIGVGFSYSNTSQDYIQWNDAKTAKDNLRFIINWLEEFPEYKDSELFLAGESYAGHYLPQLATLLIKHNKQHNVRPINLKAIALGNPLLDLDISVLAGNFLWSHGAISDETMLLEKTVCNFSRYVRQQVHQNISMECQNVFNQISDEISQDVDTDYLLSKQCLSLDNAEQFRVLHNNKHGKKHVQIGDPCLPGRIFTYLNNPQVQKALHANTTLLPDQWDFCSGPLMYQVDNLDMNLIPIVTHILKEGIPILLYSGDQDSKVPLTQTRMIAKKIAKDLKLIPLTKYSTWYDRNQVAGWSQVFGSLKMGKNVTYLTYATQSEEHPMKSHLHPHHRLFHCLAHFSMDHLFLARVYGSQLME